MLISVPLSDDGLCVMMMIMMMMLRGQGWWWGLATSLLLLRWQVALAPLSRARLRLRSSDCNGVTTAVSSQPPHRQHHTVSISYQPHKNHKLFLISELNTKYAFKKKSLLWELTEGMLSSFPVSTVFQVSNVLELTHQINGNCELDIHPKCPLSNLGKSNLFVQIKT